MYLCIYTYIHNGPYFADDVQQSQLSATVEKGQSVTHMNVSRTHTYDVHVLLIRSHSLHMTRNSDDFLQLLRKDIL